MEWLTAGLVSLFFWVLIGQYAYREARREQRSAPKWQGLCWGVLGVLGTFQCLLVKERRTKQQLGWLGVAILLIGLWAAGPVVQQEPAGWYGWAGLYGALFILYWQFALKPAEDGRSTISNSIGESR